MAKLLITTQTYENYGSAAEPYWKPKGGCDYVVKNVDECDMIDVIVDRARPHVECDNEYYREYILGWSIVADSYLTEFEQSQLDYEGKITYPAKELVW